MDNSREEYARTLRRERIAALVAAVVVLLLAAALLYGPASRTAAYCQAQIEGALN